MAIIRYLVNDVEAAMPFYEAMGFHLVERMGPPFAIMDRDDLRLWLSGPASSAARPLADGTKPAPGGWNRLVIQVEDLDASIQTLREQKLRFRSPLVEGPGGRQILVEDPSGNPVELFQPARRAVKPA